MSASLREAQTPSIAGYVEAMTDNAALGWVWSPGHPEPLTVQLRLGNEVAAETVADGMRDDLARGGIGSGRHAFSLPVPESHRTRLAELRVFVRRPDGESVPLGVPPAEDGVAERLANIQRAVEMVVGSQRLLHRNVQAALLKPEATGALSAAEIFSAQSALQDGISTLELFVTRLERALAAQHARSRETAGPRTALACVAGLSLLALLASFWALARTLLG